MNIILKKLQFLPKLKSVDSVKLNRLYSTQFQSSTPLSVSKSHASQFHSDHDRTTVTMLNRESDAPLMVDTFSNRGFRLNNGIAVMGPIVLFPKTLLSWHVTSSEELTKEAFSIFQILAPKLDLLILGKGDRTSNFDASLITFLRSKGVNLEVLPTDHAVATYNFLNDERRCVAGAFIPPQAIEHNSDDIAEAIERKRDLYEVSKDSF